MGQHRQRCRTRFGYPSPHGKTPLAALGRIPAHHRPRRPRLLQGSLRPRPLPPARRALAGDAGAPYRPPRAGRARGAPQREGLHHPQGRRARLPLRRRGEGAARPRESPTAAGRSPAAGPTWARAPPRWRCARCGRRPASRRGRRSSSPSSNRSKHPHPVEPWYVYKVFFRCERLGGELAASAETPEVNWFPREALPPLSVNRVTEDELELAFAHRDDPGRVAEFD